ncbi:hypothetical protein [Ruminococcus flavefaciens]|uniref:hypothetical protein n=1 Tax=Ruminococcus flavefaciens TaxID=1265 RepID=UPI00048FE635|nr:hypothetical protein [Ruminococcus flavefaciens]
MDFEEEYKQNRTAMKKVKKTETWIFIVFAVNIAVAGFYLFLAISGDLLSIIIAVLGLAGSALGLLSVRKRDSALAIAAGVLVIAEVGVMFFSDGISVLGVVEVAVFTYFAVGNFLNIKKYRWLEQQDGFPNFEPRLKEYDMDRAQRNIKDPYAQKMEDMHKNNTHEMQEL